MIHFSFKAMLANDTDYSCRIKAVELVILGPCIRSLVISILSDGYTHTHTHTCMYTNTHMHIHTHTHIHTHMHTQTCTYTNKHIYSQTKVILTSRQVRLYPCWYI